MSVTHHDLMTIAATAATCASVVTFAILAMRPLAVRVRGLVLGDARRASGTVGRAYSAPTAL